MKKLAVCICILLYTLVHAQSKLQFIDNFHRINSISPADTNFTDLYVIGKAIGDAQVVFLGEQDHGNGATFEAKTRLIKYLHEKLGFNVLAFESDFYGLARANEKFEHDTLSVDIVRYNTYTIWSKCKQSSDVYDYIARCKKTNPLHVAGIDCRHSLYSRNYFSSEFLSACGNLSYCTKDTVAFNHFMTILKELDTTEYKSIATKADKNFFYKYLDGIKLYFEDSSFYRQALNNLEAYAQNSWKESMFPGMIRDKAMAENLLWLKNNTYKGDKIIVWAHNGHCMKNYTSIPGNKKTKGHINWSMGNFFVQQYVGKTYILGFTSLYGASKWANLDTARKFDYRGTDCFETGLNAKGYDYGFINFSSLNYEESFNAAMLDNTLRPSNWTKNFDGIFYIKEMYGCDRVK